MAFCDLSHPFFRKDYQCFLAYYCHSAVGNFEISPYQYNIFMLCLQHMETLAVGGVYYQYNICMLFSQHLDEAACGICNMTFLCCVSSTWRNKRRQRVYYQYSICMLCL